MMLKTFLITFLVIFFGGLVIFFNELIVELVVTKLSTDHSSIDILHKLEHAPDFYLDEVNSSTPIFSGPNGINNNNCHFFNCFNIYRCVDHTGKQKKFHVHIPTPKRFLARSDQSGSYQEVSPLTLEYVEILEAIAGLYPTFSHLFCGSCQKRHLSKT